MTFIRPAVVDSPEVKDRTTPQVCIRLMIHRWVPHRQHVSTMRTDSSEHHGPFEPHQHPWYTAAADAGHDGTQHPAHSGELGVDLRFVVRRLERLHPPWAGLSAVPAIPAVPATPAIPGGEQQQRRGGGEQQRQRGG